jgi:hypothetical protein
MRGSLSRATERSLIRPSGTFSHCGGRRLLRTSQTGLGHGFADSAVSMGNLLWLIIIVLVILWLGGFAFHVGGSLIHILIDIALILLIYRLATGRRVL